MDYAVVIMEELSSEPWHNSEANLEDSNTIAKQILVLFAFSHYSSFMLCEPRNMLSLDSRFILYAMN